MNPKLPAILLANLAWLGGHADAHGNIYHGGGGLPPGPGAPSGPTAPGPGAPGPGAAPGSGPGAGPATGGNPGPATGPSTGGLGVNPATGGATLDPTSWEHWWHFNKEPYLELKSRVLAGEASTHADDPRANGVDAASAAVQAIAVPALEKALEKERDKDLVTGAMIALARLADGSVRVHAADWSKLFERFERDPNQEIAETSLVARGILGSEGAAPALSELLLAGPEGQQRVGGHAVALRTRAFAAYALGLLGQRASSEDLRRFVVHHLLHALRENASTREGKSAPDVQAATAIAIGLVPLAWAGSDVSARSHAQNGGLSRESEIEGLLGLLSDKEQPATARAHAPESLARLLSGAPPETREVVAKALIEALCDGREKNEVAAGCALALGSIGDADHDPIDLAIRAALRRAVEDVDVQTRCFALIALAEVGGRSGAGEDPEAGARDAQAFLLNRLAHGKVRERQWSALALGVLEHARLAAGHEVSLSVCSALHSALQDAGSNDEVGALAIAAGLMRDRSCADLLLRKLERNADAATRGYVSVALGMLGAQEALGPLRKLLAESRYRPEILREVAIGLALLGDRELEPSLLATLSEAHGAASQSAAASALGFIGNTRTLEPLAKLCENAQLTASARAFAAVALGIVGDRDRLPWHVSIGCGLNYRAITQTLIDPNGSGLLDML